jgi:hypothetical protein
MGLMGIMPMLEAIYAITKFTLMCDTFVFDFVNVVKLCCVELYNMYLDLETKYAKKKSNIFCINDQLFITWWSDSIFSM